MTGQTRRIASCHLLLRGTRWIPVSMNKKLGPYDRCSPGGAVITADFASTVADRYYVMEHGRIVDLFANSELDANLGELHDYFGV